MLKVILISSLFGLLIFSCSRTMHSVDFLNNEIWEIDSIVSIEIGSKSTRDYIVEGEVQKSKADFTKDITTYRKTSLTGTIVEWTDTFQYATRFIVIRDNSIIQIENEWYCDLPAIYKEDSVWINKGKNIISYKLKQDKNMLSLSKENSNETKMYYLHRISEINRMKLVRTKDVCSL